MNLFSKEKSISITEMLFLCGLINQVKFNNLHNLTFIICGIWYNLNINK